MTAKTVYHPAHVALDPVLVIDPTDSLPLVEVPAFLLKILVEKYMWSTNPAS